MADHRWSMFDDERMAPVEDPGVSSKVAAAEAGVSYRQLDHWISTGTITIAHAATSGQSRRLSPDDVTVLRVLGRISRALGNQPQRSVLVSAAGATRILLRNGWAGDPVYVDLPEGVQLVVETS